MEFKYTEDQIALRRAVREWAQSYLAPKAEEIDVNNRFPTETIKALGEQDLMGLAYPEELGGAGYDAISEAIAMEEISAACAATGSIITGHYLGFDALYLAGTPEQKEKWLRPALEGEKYAAFCLTEPAGGSDMTSNKTTAVEDGDSYVINGVKHFITGGAHCDFLCCFAITNKEDPKHGMTCFVVEKGTPGMKIASEDNKMGIRGARTAEIVFEDCRVPKENMVGELNGGYRLALDVVDRGRIGIAAMAVGIGSGRPGSGHQVRQGARGLQASHLQVPGHSVDAGRRRHSAGGRPYADLLRRRPEGAGRSLHQAGRDGQAVCGGSVPQGGRHRPADPRRLRLHEGVRH